MFFLNLYFFVVNTVNHVSIGFTAPPTAGAHAVESCPLF